MEQYKDIDTDKYDYEGITTEDLYDYSVHLSEGVRVITYDIYMDEIYSLKDKTGHKPWFVSIVYRSALTNAADYSQTLLKSLYFLARDFKNEVNVGIIYTDDELVREAFEYRGIPQTIFIKDGRPYYIHWNQIGIHRLLEFRIRYAELKEDAFEEL
jgi:hypothetical protein